MRCPARIVGSPWNPRVLEEVDRGTYVRRLITYQSEPESRTPAYLCIPKDVLAGQRRAPAVLCLHGTNREVGHQIVVRPELRRGRAYGAELAERGYVTLSPAYPHLANYWPNLGGLGYVSGTMKAIWDNSRGLDLLASLPYVDDSKGFASIGHSLGGHNSIYTAVLDQRIRAVVSSCGFDSYLDYYGGGTARWYFGMGWCQIRYMPRLSDYRGRLEEIPFDFHELLGALAPRSIYVSAPLGDGNFQWRSVDRCAAAARPVYRLLGGEGKPDGPASRLRPRIPRRDQGRSLPVHRFRVEGKVGAIVATAGRRSRNLPVSTRNVSRDRVPYSSEITTRLRTGYRSPLSDLRVTRY